MTINGHSVQSRPLLYLLNSLQLSHNQLVNLMV